MKVELVQTNPEAFRQEAEELARRNGHASAEEMWAAMDRGVYAGKFVEWEMRDLRGILQYCEPPLAAE